LVLAVTLVLGSTLLHDQEFRQLAKHVFAASLYLNNWVLSIEKGYFDIGSEYKPLLHLWSLSIEEQFYLLWPGLLVLTSRRISSDLSKSSIIAGIFLISLGACLVQTYTHPIGAFYSPHTRIWELVAGSALHLLTPAARQKLGQFAMSGLPVLVLGLLTLNPEEPFPGFWALLPVLGALLLIASPIGSVSFNFLSHRSLVGIGQISYPLYLWHWPLLAFASLFFGDTVGVSDRIALMGVAVTLSIATKWLIEDPLRYGGRAGLKTVGLLLCMTVLSSLAAWIYKNDGMTQREFNRRNLSLSSGDLPSIKHLINKRCDFIKINVECWHDIVALPTQVVIGDSKGKAFFTGLMHQTQGNQGWLYLGGNAVDGAPIPQSTSQAHLHHGIFDQVVATIDEMPNIRRVVLAVALRSLYQLRRDDSVLDLEDKSSAEREEVRLAVYDGLKRLQNRDREVWVLIDNPTFLNPPKCVDRYTGWRYIDQFKPPRPDKCSMSLQTHLDRTRIYIEMLRDVQRELATEGIKINLLDPTPVLCDFAIQRCEMTSQGRYLYDFTDHLSAFGAKSVAGLIAE